MTSLEVLGLGNKILNGMLPETFRNMCNLNTLTLSYNNIALDIAHLMERLPSCPERKLRELDLSQANLTGTMLNWLPNQTSLNILHVSDNQLSGPMPVACGDRSTYKLEFTSCIRQQLEWCHVSRPLYQANKFEIP